MTPVPVEIMLDETRKLAVSIKGNIFTCTLQEYSPAEQKFVQISGTDGEKTLVIEEIDSPSSFQKILQWLGENSAVALFNGLKVFRNQT